MPDLNVGDVVVLKSGGPDMTVNEVGPENVNCTWFNKDGKRVHDNFNPNIIERVESESLDDIE